MLLLAKIPTTLTVLALIVGTMLSGSGDAVICLAPDHIAFEAGPAGDTGHCSAEDGAGHHVPVLHPEPQQCTDLTLEALQLDLPRRGPDAAAMTAPFPIAVAVACTSSRLRPTCGPAARIARPPPGLLLTRLTVLRL